MGIVSGCGVGAESLAERRCAEAVLDDWASDGRIDGSYPGDCYLAAIDALPEDVRSYSSAADDISRALHARRAVERAEKHAAGAPAVPVGSDERSLSEAPTVSAAPDASGALRRPPTPLLALAGTGLVVASAGLTAAAVRAIRKRS